MRVGYFNGAFLSFLLFSCGLETIQSLNPPEANYSDGLLVTDHSLSFVHRDIRYAGTFFQGYLVYYKIYPASANPTLAVGRLVADQSALAASPTVNQLTSLGYQSFTMSKFSDGKSSSDIENLLIQGAADGTKVTLDFTDFLRTDILTPQPVLKIGLVNAEKPYIYRAMSFSGLSGQSFGSLRTASQKESDMAFNMTDLELQKREFELNVFISAYGLTGGLTEVFSAPVPWGVIRDIKP